jgi:integrase
MESSSPPPKSTSGKSVSRRPRGTGALFIKRDSAGRETWYGKWRVGSVQVKRRVGPKRIPSTRDGLTRTQAEAELRRLIGSVDHATVRRERVTVEDVGELLVASVRSRGRKRATVETYSSAIRIQLAPFFGGQTLDRIGRREIEAFIAHMSRTGRSPKTTLNALGILHSIFEYARREGWVAANPCTLVDKPRAAEGDPDIHFLEPEEVEALLRGVPDDDLGRVERRMYLAAAMTGMRQGELLALRWRDIDWPARRVRIRRSFVRGEFGTPKSKRSSRSVPLADRLAGELDRLHQETSYRRDDELVFAHPHNRQADRSLATAQALQGRAKARGSAACALPRPAPHVWYTDGCPGRANACAAGDDGPPRLQDDTDLRRLRAERTRGRVGRGGVRLGGDWASRDGADHSIRRQRRVTREEPPPNYEIELFRRADGSEPVRRFIDSLSNDKRDALLAALAHILARQGLGVCGSEWGKQLGGGLAEFRLRHDEREIIAREGASLEPDLPEPSPEKILLRVFFHAHGKGLVLLLSGYDKGAKPSTRHQQREIERARGYLQEWQSTQARDRRTSKQGAKGRRARG